MEPIETSDFSNSINSQIPLSIDCKVHIAPVDQAIYYISSIWCANQAFEI